MCVETQVAARVTPQQHRTGGHGLGLPRAEGGASEPGLWLMHGRSGSGLASSAQTHGPSHGAACRDAGPGGAYVGGCGCQGSGCLQAFPGVFRVWRATETPAWRVGGRGQRNSDPGQTRHVTPDGQQAWFGSRDCCATGGSRSLARHPQPRSLTAPAAQDGVTCTATDASQVPTHPLQTPERAHMKQGTPCSGCWSRHVGSHIAYSHVVESHIV